MSLTGAAIGAQQSLEEIVAQRVLAAKLQQEIENRQAVNARENARINETIRQNDWERKRADRLDAERASTATRIADQEATQRRGRSNMAGVLSMGLDPETTRREIAVSSLNADVDVPKGVMDMMTPAPAPRKYQVTTPGRDGRPISRLVPEEEMEQGVPVYREPREPKAPTGPQDQVWVLRNGQPTPIAKGTAQAGDTPYDAVAARSSKPENSTEAVDTAREVKRLAGALKGHKGFKGAFGLTGSYVPTIRQDTADAEQLLGSLQAMMTVENMDKMKGVLSDSDMKVLRQASTTLSNRMSDTAADSELARIIEVMGRLTGDGSPTIDTQPPPGGGLGVTLRFNPATGKLEPVK